MSDETPPLISSKSRIQSRIIGLIGRLIDINTRVSLLASNMDQETADNLASAIANYENERDSLMQAIATFAKELEDPTADADEFEVDAKGDPETGYEL